MKPFLHTRGSIARWGGKPEDYIAIHDFIDQTKIAMPDMRHRAVLHNAFGCFLVERIFGHTFKNSDGREVSTRDVAEQHIIEDMGFLPSLEDWLDELPQAAWHGGIHRLPKAERPALKGPGVALKTAIANLNAARKKYDDELAKLGKETGQAVAEFLGEHIPAGWYVEWMQYTPYFNDGEACEFGVHEPYVCKTSTEEEEDKYVEDRDGVVCITSGYGESGERWTQKLVDGLTKTAHKALQKAWGELPEDMLEAVFGDHAKVVIRKSADGELTWERSEHEHD